jgi:hypothetical protein
MKPKVLFSLVILAFILHSCNSEKKEIIGNWTDQNMSESHTWYHFYKGGTYDCLVYEPVSTEGKVDLVLRYGSIGYYRYIGPREFNLYEVDVDLSPILGKSIHDYTIGEYLGNFMESHTEPDLDSTEPSFLAQIQGDGEHLHILQNDTIIIELRRKKKERFLDMR